MPLNCKNTETNSNDLFDFLKEINCTDMQFKLLCFWRQHPKTRLGLGTIARIMEIAKDDLGGAMAALVEKDIITRHDINGLTTYSLASQQNQGYIDELTRLDLGEMVQLGKHLQEEQKYIDELAELDWGEMVQLSKHLQKH